MSQPGKGSVFKTENNTNKSTEPPGILVVGELQESAEAEKYACGRTMSSHSSGWSGVISGLLELALVWLMRESHLLTSQ